jgi:hypothetical protein
MPAPWLCPPGPKLHVHLDQEPTYRLHVVDFLARGVVPSTPSSGQDFDHPVKVLRGHALHCALGDFDHVARLPPS